MHTATVPTFRVGMILPSSNVVAERELPELLPAGISLHTTRLRLTGTSEAELLGMPEHVEAATALLADARVDLVVFHCTAVSTYSAALEQSIVQRMAAISPVPCLTAGQALVDELHRAQASQVVLVTPYPPEVTQREADFLLAHGVHVLSSHSGGISEARHMTAQPASHWQEQVWRARRADAQAYVLSCNGIWTNDARRALQAALQKPVITSNSAVAAACMAHAAARDNCQA